MSKSNSVAIVEADSVVASMMRASSALAQAQTIQQTKKILDVAHAAEIYAKRQHLGEEAMGIAASIKVEALRKLGEMLQVAPRAKGEIFRGTKKEPRGIDAPTLEELGLTKKESAVAQKLAALPDEQFAQVREGNVSVAKAIAAVSETKATQAGPKPSAIEVNPLVSELADAREAVAILSEENDRLNDRLAVESMPANAEEQRAASDTISDLRSKVKTLEAELSAVKASRDGFMRENVELKRQVAMQRKQLGRMAA